MHRHAHIPPVVRLCICQVFFTWNLPGGAFLIWMVLLSEASLNWFWVLFFQDHTVWNDFCTILAELDSNVRLHEAPLTTDLHLKEISTLLTSFISVIWDRAHKPVSWWKNINVCLLALTCYHCLYLIYSCSRSFASSYVSSYCSNFTVLSIETIRESWI